MSTSRPPLVTIATSKVDTLFEKHISAAKAHQNSRFFAISMKCPKWGPLWKFGLDIPLDGVLVTSFVLRSFLCANDLNLSNTIAMPPRIVSVDLVSCERSGKVTCIDFQHGTRFLIFEWGLPVNNLKILNQQPWLPWKPNLYRDSFWTSFQKNLTWMYCDKSNRVYVTPPPLVLEHKKAWLG